MAYSKEELLQCICECMAESLPKDWEHAYMQTQIEGRDIDSKFRYTAAGSATEQRFQPRNFIASLNAAKELQRLMASEGKPWSRVTVKIAREGGSEVITE